MYYRNSGSECCVPRSSGGAGPGRCAGTAAGRGRAGEAGPGQGRGGGAAPGQRGGTALRATQRRRDGVGPACRGGGRAGHPARRWGVSERESERELRERERE